MASLDVVAERVAERYQPPATGRQDSPLGDAATLKELLTMLATGQRRSVACSLAGITEQTFYNWQKQADAGQEPQRMLFDAVKRAESMAEQRIVQNVLSASEKPQFWAAGMTYLERKYPEHWGRRTDDSSSPKVIVQIGGDVKDLKLLTIAPSSSDETLSLVPRSDLPCGNQG